MSHSQFSLLQSLEVRHRHEAFTLRATTLPPIFGYWQNPGANQYVSGGKSRGDTKSRARTYRVQERQGPLPPGPSGRPLPGSGQPDVSANHPPAKERGESHSPSIVVYRLRSPNLIALERRAAQRRRRVSRRWWGVGPRRRLRRERLLEDVLSGLLARHWALG